MEQEPSNLPAQIANALVSIPKALTPGVIKALDRLLGAAVDVPVAWLAQRKAKIDAQTESYRLVETSIAQAVALDVGADPETAQRAMNVLVRKEYRKQLNREAVAAAMVEDMREHMTDMTEDTVPPPVADLADDWLMYLKDMPKTLPVIEFRGFGAVSSQARFANLEASRREH